MTIYSDSEHYGLTIVGEVDWTDEPYEFNMTVVWRDLSGKLYWAEDKGCSCPEPFQNMGLPDLNQASFHDIAAHLNQCADDHPSARDRAVELIARIRELA